MSRLRIQNIAKSQDTTATSNSYRLGGMQTMAEAGRAITTLVVAGEFGSGNGDTVRGEVSPTASGPWAPISMDPFGVQAFIDASGEFAAAGAVDLTTGAGLFFHSIFRAPSGTGSSSIEVWLVGAFCSASA